MTANPDSGPDLATGHLPAPQRLADRVYGAILERIATGQLTQGHRLPAEQQLAASFGVSRPIVREALLRLQVDGLVESRKGSGTYVRSQPAPALLKLMPVNQLADMLRCYELRQAVEGDAAHLAALRHDAADLRALRQALAGLEEVIASGAIGAEADLAFHQAVANAAHNTLFTSVMAWLKQPIDGGIRLARRLSLLKPRERIERVQREHLAVFKAIAARDPETARAAMRRHLDNARRRVLDQGSRH